MIEGRRLEGPNPSIIMLTGIIERLNRMSRVDIHPLIQKILQDRDIQDRIIYLNTIDQLFEKGEDSLGRKLSDVGGDYSPYTIMKKIEKGQPTDRVTLRDKGDYYDSYKISAPDGVDYIIIITNPIKEGKNIEEEWGGFIVGLNTENTQWLINEVRERLIPMVKAALLAA
jgi:hypothetical protein